MISVYLDESVNPQIAVGLKARGIQAIPASEVGLLGASDEEHVMQSARLGAVLLTHDADFLKIADGMRREGISHPGIIYAHLRKYGLGIIVKKAAAIARENTPESMTDQVIFL